MTNPPHPASTLSGPPASLWLGCSRELRRDTLGLLLQCQQYGHVARLPLGLLLELLLRQRGAAMYVLNQPADVKHVLVTNQENYRKAPVPPVESRIFGQGVLHSEGRTHHHQRRLLLPFFHGNHVTTYAGLITTLTHERLAGWQEGSTIDIAQEMAQLTLSVIWRLLFSQDVGDDTDTIREAIQIGQSLIKLQYDSLLASLTPLWVPTPRHRQFMHSFTAVEAIIRRLIEQRRTSSHVTRDDILTLLLAAKNEDGRPLSDDEIRDELVTFLLAGHETTANALTWTWWLLSQSPSARTGLTRELHETIGDRLPVAADVSRLRYTKMIWEESLRLYPPAWTFHTRVSHTEDQLPSGVVLPPRAWVVISPWSLHHNPQWFPDPNHFDPERFSDEATKSRPTFSYIPFGAGGRHCLGESFAELEGLLILGTIASKVHLHLVAGQAISPEPVMTLRPNAPVRMIVRRTNASDTLTITG